MLRELQFAREITNVLPFPFPPEATVQWRTFPSFTPYSQLRHDARIQFKFLDDYYHMNVISSCT